MGNFQERNKFQKWAEAIERDKQIKVTKKFELSSIVQIIKKRSVQLAKILGKKKSYRED
jgi:hypothetical protein